LAKDVSTEELDLAALMGALGSPSVQILALYVPNKDKHGKVIRNHKTWVKRAMKVLSLIGGGSTAFPPGDGTWLDPAKRESIRRPDELKDKDLVWEKTTYLYTYIDPDLFLRNARHLRQFLHDFGRETRQGEVVFEFDEEFFRIQSYDAPEKE